MNTGDTTTGYHSKWRTISPPEVLYSGHHHALNKRHAAFRGGVIPDHPVMPPAGGALTMAQQRGKNREVALLSTFPHEAVKPG